MTGARNPENEVEAVFNGGEQHNRGDDDTDDADGCQAGGCLEKVGKICADFIAESWRQIAEEHFLNLVADAFKSRKGREDGQADGKQRDNGYQRGVAQGGGNAENCVIAGAANQKI